MIQALQRFCSTEGEMGRDDYLKASIVRALALIVFMAIVGQVLSWVVPGAAQNLSVLVWWTYPLSVAALFFFDWPIVCRRFNDLSGALSPGWKKYIFVCYFLPTGIHVTPGINVLVSILILVSLYPHIVLLFRPGNKHARFKGANAENLS
jgi:uncharacterized membrane protein YhaH (DUF805 family)